MATPKNRITPQSKQEQQFGSVRRALESAYATQGALAREASDTAKRGAIQTAGRGLSMAGVKGPVAEAVKRQTGMAYDTDFARQMRQLGLDYTTGMTGVAQKELEYDQMQRAANMQLIKDIFAGVGTLINPTTGLMSLIPSKSAEEEAEEEADKLKILNPNTIYPGVLTPNFSPRKTQRGPITPPQKDKE